MQETLDEITKILRSRGVRKVPLMIKSDEDVITAVKVTSLDSIIISAFSRSFIDFSRILWPIAWFLSSRSQQSPVPILTS